MHAQAQAQNDAITEVELQRRVIYSLLTPIVHMAARFGMSLKELNDWVSTAYFEEVRGEGLTLREAADALGVSHRTASRLSRQQRESLFFTPEQDHDLPRRIEFMVGTRPAALEELEAALEGTFEPEQVREAFELLVADGRIRRRSTVPVTFEATSPFRRLSRDTWMARVGGLNSLTRTVASAAYGRFFEAEPRAFARTLTFPALDSGVARLNRIYEDVLRPVVEDIGREAEAGDEDRSVQLSICWAPFEIFGDKGAK